MVYKESSRLLENMPKVTHKRMQVYVLQKQAEEELACGAGRYMVDSEGGSML